MYESVTESIPLRIKFGLLEIGEARQSRRKHPLVFGIELEFKAA